MLTANDLQKYIDDKTAIKDDLIDTWLKDVVFPNYIGNTQGFVCPRGVSLVEADSMLRKRGFHVIISRASGKDTIYISIPPCKP